MIANTDEGELRIQSPEITSTVPSYVYVRPLIHANHVQRFVRPSLEPVLWNPNQGNHSRFIHDLWSSLQNALYNGNVVTCIKDCGNGCCTTLLIKVVQVGKLSRIFQSSSLSQKAVARNNYVWPRI
jgi:hypothetical protein